jgi:hypothetical protein
MPVAQPAGRTPAAGASAPAPTAPAATAPAPTAVVAPDPAPASAARPPGGKAPASAHCAFCDSAIPGRSSVRFCPFCGTDQTHRPCSACGEALEPGWRFCVACGATTEAGA